MNCEKIIIKDFYVEEMDLVIDSNTSIEKMAFVSKKELIKVLIKDNKFNLEKFVKENEVLLNISQVYTVALLNEEVVENIRFRSSKTEKKRYIFNNKKIKIENREYAMEAYLDAKGLLKFKIKAVLEAKFKILVEEANIQKDRITFKTIAEEIVDEEEIFVADNQEKKRLVNSIENENTYTIEQLEETLKSHSKDLTFFVTSKTGVSKSYNCTTVDGTSMQFQLGLKDIENIGNDVLYISVGINNVVLPLKFKSKISFKNICIKNENSIQEVLLKSEEKTKNCILDINNEFDINPKVRNVKYSDENGLELICTLNSSLELVDNERYIANLIMVSSDEKVTINEQVIVENDEFTFNIATNELFDLKDQAPGNWNLSIEIINKENDNELIVKEIKYKKKKDEQMFKKLIQHKKKNLLVGAVLSKDKKFFIKIKNKVTITSILSIYVYRKKFVARYRTSENIESLLDGKEINTSIANVNEKLEMSKIKKIGKKTYVVTYNAKNPKEFMDLVLEKGVVLQTKTNKEVYINEFKEVDRQSIFYNKMDAIRHTKKYKNICSKIYEKLFLKLPIKDKTVVFESFLGRNMSGNPKYLYKYFVEQGLDKEYKLIWILNDIDTEIEGNCEKVRRKSLKYYYYMATSQYWVFNARQADEIVKREGTTYLQTWHGTPLKRLASDMFNVNMAGVSDVQEYIDRFYKNSRRWDYLMAQNEYSAEIFKRCFNFNKEVLFGYSANDILYTDNNEVAIDNLKEKFELPKDKKVILYAPTWRDDNVYKKGHYKMTMELELRQMQEKIGDEYIVILKMHYLITNSINISDFKGFVYDLSIGTDIQELYLVSDILITDYSSTMFDFANLRRNTIFFTYDIENYRDSLRGFYFDLEEEAPGPVVKTTEEVVDSILNIEKVTEEYKEKEQLFYDKFCHIDRGHTAENIFNKIFK